MATNSRRTKSQKGPRSIAKDLRSAASALEHGRHSTAQKKLAAIAPSFSPLSLGDSELAVLDEALNSAENILTPLLKRYDSETLTMMFKQHVSTHLGTELSNISEHGRRSFPQHVPCCAQHDRQRSCSLTLFEELTGLASLVAAGNTEIDRLEARAQAVLGRMKNLGIGGN